MDSSDVSASWLWDFGDGSFDSVQYPVHSYTGPGIYYVCLTINNLCGSDIFCDSISLPCLVPAISFSGLNTLYCISDNIVNLSGIPAGGNFTGPGIIGTQFDPAIAGEGTHAISYSYTDSNNCSDSAVQNVVVTVCSGVAGLHFPGTVEVYPNPTTGKVIVELKLVKTLDVELRITNILGQEVFSEDLKQLSGTCQKSLNIKTFGKGVYQLHVKTNGGTIVRKIVVE